MTRALALLVALAALLLVGCPSPSTADTGDACASVPLEGVRCPPCPKCAPDASPAAADAAAASVEARACANLARLGCPEGADAAWCAAKVQQAEADRLTNVDASCLAGATTPTAARRCGFVKCLPDGGLAR